MASERELVTLAGHLTAPNGEQTACRLRAVKITLPGADIFEYDRFELASIFKPLLDGAYTLTVNGQKHNVKLYRGHLLSADGS